MTEIRILSLLMFDKLEGLHKTLHQRAHLSLPDSSCESLMSYFKQWHMTIYTVS